MVRVLIGLSPNGNAMVLATDSEEITTRGVGVSWYFEEIVGYDDTPTEPGLYLWEGESHLDGGCPDYAPDTIWEGAYRAVRPDELAGLFAMKPPDNTGG